MSCPSLLFCFISYHVICTTIALYPRESETRQIKVLDGLWDFRIDNSSNRNAGFANEWYKHQLKNSGNVMKMPVPASYNDITQDSKIRDFVGWAWYDYSVFVPKSWDDEDKLRTVLRFESCHYHCIVWLNGEKVMEHDGGHLPFETEVTNLKYGLSNIVTVAANNTLTPKTLPPGSIEYFNDTNKYPPGYFVQHLQMDFFNYAGIHRSVLLYTTPTVYLLDVTVFTDFTDNIGILQFKSSVAAMKDDDDDNDSKNEDIMMNYVILNADGSYKTGSAGNNLFKGEINVTDVNLWWPVDTMHSPGYMYTLVVTVNNTEMNIVDIYRLPFGFRTVHVDEKNLFINNKPFYLKGFGMHEDSDIRGKGFDFPLWTKNFNLIDWIGGNAFRTSHYPYAEEIMDMADHQGIVVIDECPGVGIQRENMQSENLEHHKDVMKELVRRDKNHPSVIMWSVANEPESQYDEAGPYFKEVISYTKKLDSTRPVTFVGNQNYYDDKAVKYNDVICFNHYYAWYHDMGHLEVISLQLEYDLKKWHSITKKPVILSEYGADCVPGLHRSPSVMFTEDYQVDTVKQYFPVFDKYRGDFFIGEMIWNFADFATAQETTRVGGNKKGIFTRERQPKYVAHVLRERYKSISSLIANATTTRRGVARDNVEDDAEGYLVNVVSV